MFYCNGRVLFKWVLLDMFYYCKGNNVPIHAKKAYRGSACTTPLILKFGTV